jgi:hypothetical protein
MVAGAAVVILLWVFAFLPNYPLEQCVKSPEAKASVMERALAMLPVSA